MNICEYVDLKLYNTYGIGGKAKYLIKPNDVIDLKNSIDYLNCNNTNYYVLGNGSNVILPDDDYEGAIIILSNFKNIKIDDDILEVYSGVMLPYLNRILLNNGYINFVWASCIPGTIGGSVINNAGAYNHDIFEYLIDITYLEGNDIKTINKNNISYGYRHTNIENKIIIKARFKLVKGDISIAKKIMNEQILKRKSTQPLEHKNAGSVFKNPVGFSAGKLIERAGLKGKIIGGAKVSEKHANFIINYNNATSNDIKKLIKVIQSDVKEKFGIHLELEQKIINWK